MLVLELIFGLIFLVIGHTSAHQSNNSDVDLTEFGHNAHRVFISPRIDDNVNPQISYGVRPLPLANFPQTSASEERFYNQRIQEYDQRLNPSTNRGKNNNIAGELHDPYSDNNNKDGKNYNITNAGHSSMQHQITASSNHVNNQPEVLYSDYLSPSSSQSDNPLQRSNPPKYYNQLTNNKALVEHHNNQTSNTTTMNYDFFNEDPTAGTGGNQKTENQGDPQNVPGVEHHNEPLWHDDHALNQHLSFNEHRPINQVPSMDYSERQPRVNPEEYPRSDPYNQYYHQPPAYPNHEDHLSSYSGDRHYEPSRYHVDPSPSYYEHEFQPVPTNNHHYPYRPHEAELHSEADLHLYEHSNEDEPVYGNPAPEYYNSNTPNAEHRQYSNYYPSGDSEPPSAYSEPYPGEYDEYAQRKFPSHYSKPEEVSPYNDRWHQDPVPPPYHSAAFDGSLEDREHRTSDHNSQYY